ncbi:uncharacterized protein LOC113295075 [Papaver somniferum]|uniref:uncharacterized protein LOC113295075 n=1 Tax=Papaver somniferum TaxID=3469 RepID=UPI000E704EB2|nr:uncharacterized protein LOC113295075 [Papaver somniferum]
MEKAFDNLNMISLFIILKKHGFGDKWVQWLYWCVTSAQFSILVNGVASDKIKPSKGLKLNIVKNTITSIGVDNLVEELALELGCRATNFLVTYLGLLAGASHINIAIWDVVIDKMQKRFAVWKNKYLNKAGRSPLIKYALQSIPTYYLSLLHLPVFAEKKLNTIVRKFLWGVTGFLGVK